MLLTDKGLEHLDALPMLKSVDLEQTSITDAALPCLRRLAKKGIDLDGLESTQLTNEAVKQLQQDKLQRLVDERR